MVLCKIIEEQLSQLQNKQVSQTQETLTNLYEVCLFDLSRLNVHLARTSTNNFSNYQKTGCRKDVRRNYP